MIEWLPERISRSTNSLDEDYAMFFEFFKRDFIDSTPYFEGEKVVYRATIDSKVSGSYPVGFTHIVTCKNGNQRIIDYERASRLPWIRPIIEHYNDERVIVMKRKESTVGYGIADVTYLWLDEEDFLIILRHVVSGPYRGQMLVTAYYISESYKRKQLRDKLEQQESRQ